jgi:hypothetical protein
MEIYAEMLVVQHLCDNRFHNYFFMSHLGFELVARLVAFTTTTVSPLTYFIIIANPIHRLSVLVQLQEPH